MSIALALQQLAPLIRSGARLPQEVPVPFHRNDGRGAAGASEPRTIAAPHRLKCRVCGRWIRPGEPVRVHARGAKKRRWQHAEC